MQITKQVKSPRKQRKQLFTAPAHRRHKFMAAPLAPDLIASKGVKAMPVRKGDTIRVMRGDHKGFEGKISRVDLKNYHVYVEGLTREKVDGTTIFVSVHPSKVMIKNLNLDDKWRKRTVERKQPLGKKEVKKAPEKAMAKVEKPIEKAVKAVETKRKVPARMKKEKPAEKQVKSVEAKAITAPKIKAEKPTRKKSLPVSVTKPKAETELPEKPEKEKKPARKRVKAAAKKPTVATAESREEKALAEEQKVVKKPKAPAKKATVKKTPAKSKAKAEKAGGT